MVSFVYSVRSVALDIGNGNGVIKAREFSALDEAHSVLLAAENKSAEIIEAAHARYQSEEERGYLVGLGRANEENIARLISEQVNLQSRLKKIEQELTDVVKNALRQILSNFSAHEIAEATIHRAIEKMRRENSIQIYFPPSLAADFDPIVVKLKSSFPEIGSIELLEDNTLEPPNVILESPTGRITCNLDCSLNALDALIDTAALGQLSDYAEDVSNRDTRK